MLEAQDRLVELVAAVERGEDVVIARSGTPVVQLVAIESSFRPVALGSLAGEVEVREDFDAPLDDFEPYGRSR